MSGGNSFIPPGFFPSQPDSSKDSLPHSIPSQPSLYPNMIKDLMKQGVTNPSNMPLMMNNNNNTMGSNTLVSNSMVSHMGHNTSLNNGHSISKPDLRNTNSLRDLNNDAIHMLYDQFPFQCKQCAMRFLEQKQLDNHYDWHFEINKREKDKSKTEKPVSRTWFLSLNDWLDTKGGLESSTTIKVNPFGINDEDQEDDNVQQEVNVQRPKVKANEDENECHGCGEALEQEFDSEQDDWYFKDTLRSDEGHLYHIKCYEIPKETKVKKLESDSSEETT